MAVLLVVSLSALHIQHASHGIARRRAGHKRVSNEQRTALGFVLSQDRLETSAG